MHLQLDGLTAVVTGGTAGIGAAIVRALASEGCAVEFCARAEDSVARTSLACADLPGHVRGTVLDVVDEDAMDRWLARVGAYDIFVPNVSAISADWKAAIEVDIQATVRNTEVTVPYLLCSKHAAITYIGSKAGSLAAPLSAAYGASKAAMAHYMKSLSARLLPGVRVNTVSPGDTLADHGVWDRARSQEPAVYERVVGRNPMGRLATPDEIAKVVAFISSPAASFVAGANWYVDGGSIAHVQI